MAYADEEIASAKGSASVDDSLGLHHDFDGQRSMFFDADAMGRLVSSRLVSSRLVTWTSSQDKPGMLIDSVDEIV